MLPLANRTCIELYRIANKSGVLSFSLGQVVLEKAYWIYKSFYEARDLKYLHPYVPFGSTVIDVGANFGFYSLTFASWVGATGRVISIEPAPDNVDRLKKTVGRAAVDHIVKIVEAAAAEFSGQVSLQLNLENPMFHCLGEGGIPVRAITIDDLFNHDLPRISLIKIDVQGAEARVIRGAERVLRTCHPGVYMEIDLPALSQCGTTPEKLIKQMADLEYAPHSLGDGQFYPCSPDEMLAQVRKRDKADFLFKPVSL